MADKVRILMEDMLPDMLQFMKRKVFEKDEVQEIMKTREQHEYRLLRKNTSAIEFLQTIQFEYDLERRRKQKFEELKIRRIQTKDYSIIRRTIQLWDKLTDKFKYNTDLWKQYLSLCYFLKSKKLFFKTISRAVNYNPQNLEFWLMAIYYEYEANNNPFKARKIFYKLLKVQSNNMDVWVEYFKFEFKFLEQIYLREQILSQKMEQEEKKIDFIEEEEKKIDFIEDEDNEDGEFKADFIKLDENEKDQQDLKNLEQAKVTSSSSIIELLKLIYDLAMEKFKNLKFVVTLLKSINSSEKSENLKLIVDEVRNIILQDADQKIKGNLENLDSLLEFYLEKHSISINIESEDLMDDFFSEIFSIEDQQLELNILNGMINYMSKDENDQISRQFFQNDQFKKYFEKKSIQQIQNHKNKEIILQIYVKFQDQKITKNFEQYCLTQLSENQQLFNINEIILLTKIISKNESLEILENQLIENFQKLSKEGIYRYLQRYLELSDLSDQYQVIKIINWSIQKLLIFKEEFKKIFQQFLQKINEQNYSQKIYELLFNKLMNLNSLCPLDIYALYISQQDCKKLYIQKQVDMLFDKIQQWFKQNLGYWELYLAHKFRYDPQECPAILEIASKVSGIKYSELFSMYNSIQNKQSETIFEFEQ